MGSWPPSTGEAPRGGPERDVLVDEVRAETQRLGKAIQDLEQRMDELDSGQQAAP